MGSNEQIDETVDSLVSQMTVAEKVAQLGSIEASTLMSDGDVDAETVADELEHGVGHITRFGGDAGLSPTAVAAATTALQELLAETTRLGIPALPHEECLSGYMGPDGTTFPQSIGLASSWNPALVREVTERISAQLSAIGTEQALSPVCDLARDLRWGRVEETFGEDPYLAGSMVTAYVTGLQSGDDSVDATLKHFVGHGRGAGGKNRSSVAVGPRTLREMDCFPFEAAIATADARSVMNAYHDIDGVPCASNEWLLTDLLREEFGFDGTVVADYYSVRYLETEHGIAADGTEAAKLAVRAGVDVELPATDCYEELVAMVEDGTLDESYIDRAVRRVLRAKQRVGLFDDAAVETNGVRAPFDDPAATALAEQAARESMVLVKNEDETLPLDESEIDSVAVVGPSADDITEQLGDYAWAAHHVDVDRSIDGTTPLAGIRDRLEDGDVTVDYVAGCTTTGTDASEIEKAVATADDADVTLSFVGARSSVDFSDGPAGDGETAPTSGEGCDVTSLGFPGVQEQLLDRLSEADTTHIPVIVSGRPHTIDDLVETVPALLYAWLPGEQGGTAIAELLFGDRTPCGRLPVSLPRSVGQLPVAYNRRPNSASERYVYSDSSPVYPFGHGLTYTSFEITDVALDGESVDPDESITVSATVTNTGDRAGHEVVQVYAHACAPAVARPVQELVGFQRLALDPGASKRVAITIDANQLAYHDQHETFATHPGEYELRIGHSAEDIVATKSFEISAFQPVATDDRTYFSECTVESGE